MTDAALETFAREIADEVLEAVHADGNEPYSEAQFTRIMLEDLAEEGLFENPIYLAQGGEGRFDRTPYKITGFSLSDDNERLVLITTVFTGHTPPQPVSRELILSAIERAMHFYDASRRGLHEKMEPANTDASDLARNIHEAHGDVRVLRVVVLSDGYLATFSKELANKIGGVRFVAELYGIEQLHRILGEGQTRADIVLDVLPVLGAPIPCLKVNGGAQDYETYLAAIPATLLSHTYERYGMRLLELNVRAFLGVRGRKSVNAGLRRTLTEEAHRFLAYNNGIVATVDAIELAPMGAGITKLMGLQIVNGGQTTASIHRAIRQDRAKLDGVMVPAKIIKVGGNSLTDMVRSISRSANSQNTVQPADFSANDAFHVHVEQLANNTWLPGASGRWMYERARGSYGAAEAKAGLSKVQLRQFRLETPKSRRFSKTDLAKSLNAWDGFPNWVSYGSQKNFQHFMQRLKQDHPDGFIPDPDWYRRLIAMTIVFRSVHDLVRQQKFPAYQANITAYTVALLGYHFGQSFDHATVWTAQTISEPLRDMIREWVRHVDAALRKTAQQRMPTEWAKREECWLALQGIPLTRPNPPPPELRGGR